MSIIHETYIYGGVTVKYKYRKAVGDRRDLIVIFSGFRSKGTYDFDGAPIQGVRGNILWIMDDFSDSFAYYLCDSLDFIIEEAIVSLIGNAISYLGISKDQCSVVGFSKGGTAALYYGIKYNYGAILATVPQMHIGTSVKKKWPDVFNFMTKNSSAAEREYLDNIMPELLRSDNRSERNIYLFSSESDPQHRTSVEPYIDEFRKYSNFNYILTSSPLVDSHSAVTRYNVPAITSIMSLLSEGVRPILGDVLNGSLGPSNDASGLTLEKVRERNELVHAITSIALQGSMIFPDGHAFIKGYSAEDYGIVKTKIRFRADDAVYEFALGGAKDPLLSTRYYEHQYCDYSTAKFASLGHKGISMADLPEGRYGMSLDVRHAGIRHLVQATSSRPLNMWSIDKGYLYNIQGDESRLTMTKRPSLGPKAKGAYFKEVGRWASDRRIHFEGYFAVEGHPTPNYHDVKYYLVLCPVRGGGPVGAFQLASDNRADINEQFPDSWLDHSKSYYATRRYEGIELAGTPAGEYRAFITARFGEAVFSEELEGVVSVSAHFSAAQSPKMSAVDTLGVVSFSE